MSPISIQGARGQNHGNSQGRVQVPRDMFWVFDSNQALWVTHPSLPWESGTPPRTVKTVLSRSTPCSAHWMRLPCPGRLNSTSERNDKKTTSERTGYEDYAPGSLSSSPKMVWALGFRILGLERSLHPGRSPAPQRCLRGSSEPARHGRQKRPVPRPGLRRDKDLGPQSRRAPGQTGLRVKN